MKKLLFILLCNVACVSHLCSMHQHVEKLTEQYATQHKLVPQCSLLFELGGITRRGQQKIKTGITQSDIHSFINQISNLANHARETLSSKSKVVTEFDQLSRKASGIYASQPKSQLESIIGLCQMEFNKLGNTITFKMRDDLEQQIFRSDTNPCIAEQSHQWLKKQIKDVEQGIKEISS